MAQELPLLASRLHFSEVSPTTRITRALPECPCVLSRLRALLQEGKATVPCLAERLTNELILHINVSQRGWVASCRNYSLPKSLGRATAQLPAPAAQQVHSANQIAHGQRFPTELPKPGGNSCGLLRQIVESAHLGKQREEEGTVSQLRRLKGTGTDVANTSFCKRLTLRQPRK